MIENLYTPGCIRTVSGQYVNLAAPDPDTILIGDIAQGLSEAPRFNGQLPQTYTVAQHCIFCAENVPPAHRFEALMHDASEAYLGDASSPLKAQLPGYRKLEDRMMRVIAKKFGFAWPVSEAVRAVDKMALELEWDSLMLAKPEARKLHCMTKGIAREGFLRLFAEHVNLPLRSR